jgi:hypothetical protein
MSTRRPARAHRRLAVLAVVTALLLAGCAQIPQSGAVKDVGPITQQDGGLGPVDFLPSGPADGATQDEILRGFIQAAVAPDGDYAVAREFLSSSLQTRWNPDASVTVDTGQSSTASGGADQKTLTITPVAFIDADGSYRQAESSSDIRQQYTFVKQKGQWRISKAPDGVVIDNSRFLNVFSPHSLYFFSPDLNYLVPDQRWFPNSPASLQTRIVKDVVQGPAKWLSGAYVSAFPQGSQLTSDSVTVTNGVADVDLNTAAGAADTLTLARMQLQLTESLTSVTGISGVRISIEGVQRPVASSLPNPEQDPQVDANALVMRGGKFGLLSGSSVTEIPGVSSKVESLSATAATLSADHRTAAVLASGAVYAVRSTVDAPTAVDSRPNLIAPTLDPSGYVWSASATSPDALIATGPTDGPVVLNVGWPDARSIAAMAMSRDGTRLAALVKTETGTHVMVAGVVRSAAGRPESVDTPTDLGPVSGGSAVSLSWVDDLDVAVLVAGAVGSSSIDVQSIGGQSQTQGGPADAVGIGPVGSTPGFWVLTSSGSLQWPRGTGWQQRVDTVQFVGQQLGKGS